MKDVNSSPDAGGQRRPTLARPRHPKIRDLTQCLDRAKIDMSHTEHKAGMMGDRADVIFASPEEISGFIANAC